MSGKHTPGPWILGGCSGRMITTPDGYVGDGFIADVDTNANARLISTAPELLAALREFTDPWNGVDMAEGTVARARAAIAKATGQAS